MRTKTWTNRALPAVVTSDHSLRGDSSCMTHRVGGTSRGSSLQQQCRFRQGMEQVREHRREGDVSSRPLRQANHQQQQLQAY
jgi:hypothetical protein